MFRPTLGMLITGASGYIGQNLCKRLSKDGVPFSVFTRRVLEGLNRGRQLIGSVEDAGSVDAAVARSDLVVHLACKALPECREDAEGSFAVNVTGTDNVARSCARRGIPMLFVSTSEVYGLKTILPIAEDSDKQPISIYGDHKLQAELRCEEWRRGGGLHYRTIRFFNIYGPAADGSPRRTVESVFLDRARRGLPMKILGNPANSRDFLYIDDAVAALVDSVGQPGNFVGETFNIASGYECNLVELARLVCELTGKSFSNLVSVEQTGPPVRFCADISKARQQLSFSPRVDLREGLERVLASFSAV